MPSFCVPNSSVTDTYEWLGVWDMSNRPLVTNGRRLVRLGTHGYLGSMRHAVIEREAHFVSNEEEWLITKQVADMFHVKPKTVWRWEIEGKLQADKTLGGHRRYKKSEVLKLLGGERDVEVDSQVIEEVPES